MDDREMMQTEIVKSTVNKDLLQKRFRCACKTYDKNAIVQKSMAQLLVETAKNHMLVSQPEMMELGCGTGLLTREIVQNFRSKKYSANDLVREVEENIVSILADYHQTDFEFIQGDAERINVSKKQNVIWSGATIQWIEDLETFFYRMSQLLNNQGFLCLSSFDVDNFLEVKALTGKGIDYKCMQHVMNYASTYFSVLESKAWHQTLWFNQPKEVLKHMRFTGVNAVSVTKWGKADLERFNTDYETFKSLKGYPLTYHPFVLILQKK